MQADIEKEKQMQAKGPAARQHELEELAAIYEGRGLSKPLAKQVAIELTEKDVIRAHARDELGIDIDDLSNPLKACVASAFAFLVRSICMCNLVMILVALHMMMFVYPALCSLSLYLVFDMNA